MTRGYAYPLASLLAGIAAAAGMLVLQFWVLVPLSLGAFFLLSWRAARAKGAVLLGALFGFMTAGAGLFSLWEIAPPSPDGGFPLPSLAAAGFLWLVPTLALASVTVLLALFLYRTRASPLSPLFAIIGWLVHEELRMWAWMLVTYGPGAVPEPHLSIAALGYSLAESPYLLQLAEGGGLFRLSIALSVFACALAAPFLGGRLRSSVCAAAALIVLVLPFFIAPPSEPKGDGLLVAVFSSNLGDSVAPGTSRLAERITATSAPDVLILPEGKALESVAGKDVRDALALYWLPPGRDALVIRSSESTDSEGVRRNTVYAESVLEGVLATYDKRFLMPEGEYLPYLSRPFLSLLPGSHVLSIPKERTVAHGTSLSAVSYEGVSFGALLCSEIFSPRLYAALAKKHGADVLVNLADPAWFRGSRLLYAKTVQIAKVHAVENRAYFLAAQNSAPSFAIDPRGRVIAQTAWGETDVLLVRLPPLGSAEER